MKNSLFNETAEKLNTKNCNKFCPEVLLIENFFPD